MTRHIEWVVYACPVCGIQHNQGDSCYGMPTNRHEPVRVERVAINPNELGAAVALRAANAELREQIAELKEEVESLNGEVLELSEQL